MFIFFLFFSPIKNMASLALRDMGIGKDFLKRPPLARKQEQLTHETP